MREPKAKWVAALRALTGVESDTIRWNEKVGRWEFSLAGADGIPRSQFWGWFYDPRTGRPLPPDQTTGLHPFRELDDSAMSEALDNLQRTFVGNRHDGAGTPEKEIRSRMRFNREHQRRKYREAGEAFADMAAERGRRIRGAPLIHVPVTIGTGRREQS